MPVPSFSPPLPGWCRIASNGVRFAASWQPPAPARPTLVLLHGFPELAWSWRHQIGALAAAGCGVLAPDLRGYGATGAHGDVAAYRLQNLARDVLGMMDALEIARAVVVGHDFGGALAWTLARDHAARIAGIAALATPYTRRTDTDLVETMRRTRGPTHYMVQYQQPGHAEALLGRDAAAVEKTLRGMFRRPGALENQFAQAPAALRALPPDVLSGSSAAAQAAGAALLREDELAVYVRAFAHTGFTGALNWYRNLRRNWEDTAGVVDCVAVPALMVSGELDIFLPPATTRGMERIVPDLERHTLEGCGHWMQQEQPEAVNALLLDWLDRRF